MRVLSWNLYHGRDFPPDPALRTWRSRFLRVSERYTTNPFPGATCPPDPYDMDLRAEIWEFDLNPKRGREQKAVRVAENALNDMCPWI